MNQAQTSRRFGVTTSALIGILLLVLFYPTIRWLVSVWLGNDYYSHGFLIPAISAVLAWRLWVKWPPEQRQIKSATAGLIPLALGLGLYLYALSARAYFVASLAMILLIASLVWFLLEPRRCAVCGFRSPFCSLRRLCPSSSR